MVSLTPPPHLSACEGNFVGELFIAAVLWAILSILCVAVCCSVLQCVECVTVCCSVLQCVEMCYSNSYV